VPTAHILVFSLDVFFIHSHIAMFFFKVVIGFRHSAGMMIRSVVLISLSNVSGRILMPPLVVIGFIS